MLSLHRDGAPPPCPAPYNLAADVLAGASAHPDRIALAVVGPARAERWSYARLEAAVRAAGAGLLAQGLAPGARVLLRLGNTPDFPVAFLGAIAAGLVPVPTSAQLTAPEVARACALVAPALIVAAPGIALPEAPPCTVLAPEALAGHGACDYAMGEPARLAYLVFTSGTSGSPRAVMHAHRAVRARRMMWDGWYGLRAGDRLLHAGAFNWTYTLGTGLLDPWAAGATALIPAPGTAPEALPLLLRRHEATIFAAAPGIYRRMLRGHATLNLPALRHGLSAGEALAPDLRTAWQAATGRDLHEALGMSECSTFVSGSPGRPARPGTCGWPQPGRQVAVLGPEGAPVARGEAGTLAIHRSDPGLFLGYFGAEAETAARFRGQWFLTGDNVVMHEDGAIAYLGRDDDMMNAGGFRVSPGEVEAALAACPGVTEIAAAEVRVKRGASVVAAFYVAADDIDTSTMSEFAARHLARYKQPRLYVRVAALPRTPTGKINRRALRADWEAENGQA